MPISCRLTGAVRLTVTVCAASPHGLAAMPGGPPWRQLHVLPIGGLERRREAPRSAARRAMPSATPITAPTMPCTMDSPSTWPTMRRLFQPSALSVPNSRTRRETAETVSRLATAKEAIRAATASHLPSRSASVEALESEPLTWPARSEDGRHGRLGHELLDLLLDGGDVVGAVGLHVDLVDLVLVVAELLRPAQGDVDVGRRAAAGQGDDADDLELDLPSIFLASPTVERVLLGVGLGHERDLGVRVGAR